MNKSEEWKMSKAIAKGDLYFVESFIDIYGLDYSDNWSGGFKLLNEALNERTGPARPKVALLLLSKGAKVNTANTSTSTPLHYAANVNHVGVVQELLERGAMVNASDESGQTPLHIAVSLIRSDGYLQFNLEIIRLLLENGADVNATDNSGGTPLLYAIKRRDLKYVQTLIQYCTNINFKSGVGKSEFKSYTPLLCAVRYRKQEVVELLLQKGADVNVSTEDGETALHMAVNAFNCQIATILISWGADVNIGLKDGETVLHVAAKGSRCEIAEILINRGANVSAVFTSGEFEGYTPLHIAVSVKDFGTRTQADRLKLIELLVTNGANVNAESKDHVTPLQIATYNCKEGEVELLLQHGANPNVLTKDNKTALHIAVEKGSSNIVEQILKYSPDLNVLTNDNETALHIAVEKGSSNIVEQILKYSPDLNVLTKDNKTALHIAVENGSSNIVEQILKYSPDLSILTKDNKTLLRIAVENGSSKIVDYILKYSPDLNNDLYADILRVALFDNKNVSHDIIRQLLDYGFSVANEPNKASMFYGAVKEKSTAIVEELLKHGFQVNKMYKFKRNWSFVPLHLVVQLKRLSEARLLISHGADVNALDKAQKTPISYVCLERDSGLNFSKSTSFQMLKLLLEKGAKPEDNPGLLPSAFRYADTDSIKFLLEHDVDVNGRDSSGVSALHYSVSRFCKLVPQSLLSGFCNQKDEADFKSSLQIVKLLLEKKADVNAKTKTDIAVLHIAAMLSPRFLELLQTLVEHNADVNIRCDTITPLHLCAFKRNSVFCRFLLNKGANVNAKLQDAKTAAHVVASTHDGFQDSEAHRKFKKAFVCFKESVTFSRLAYYPDRGHNDFEMMKALVEFGADLNVKDDKGKTPLHEAAENRFPKDTDSLIPILIKHGADWTSRDKHLKTPLHYAAQGSMMNVRILVEFGADINSKDVDGCSPLHRLVQSVSYNVSGLLNLGSDINVVNNDDQTPLEIAVGAQDSGLNSLQRQRVFKVLKKHIIKLKAANLQVDSKNLIALESSKGDDGDFYEDYYCECEREMDRIKVELIGESDVSFHDFLTSGRRELDRLAKNDKLMQALEVEDFREFPIYAPEFKLKVVYLRQASRRSNLLERSKEVFVVCIAGLPDLCMDVVFDQLSDDDLVNLVRVSYPSEVFPQTNYSECEGYLREYDHNYENDYVNEDRYYDDDYDYDCERSDTYIDSDDIDSDRWRRWT